MSRLIVSVAALMLAACSYPVEPEAPQTPTPFMAYAAKVPGKWLLIVDASAARATPEVAEPRCDQFDYPVDTSKAFVQMTASTFEQVAEEVRLSDHKLSHAEFASGGFVGTIAVRVTDFHPRIKIEGMIEPDVDAQAEITASLTASKAGRPLFEISETGKSETATREAGIICGGVADALSDASNTATQDLVRKLAEQFANSRAVRFSVPGLTPQ